MERPIPGHSKEAGLEICKQLSIDPEKVLSINVFALSNDVIWGDVIPSRRSRPGPRTLGVPVVNVDKGLCCWIRSWGM